MKLLLQIIHQLSITIGIQEMDASAEFAGAPELINSWLQVSELQEYNVTRLRLNGPRLCCMKPPRVLLYSAVKLRPRPGVFSLYM